MGFWPAANQGSTACDLALNALSPKPENSLVLVSCSGITDLKVCVSGKCYRFYLYKGFDFGAFFAQAVIEFKKGKFMFLSVACLH